MKIIYTMEFDLDLPRQEKPANRDTRFEEHGSWRMCHVKERIDSFNFDKLVNEIDEIVGSSNPYLILNFETTNFVSIPFINKMSEWSRVLRRQGLPLVVFRPSEKLKRQIDIFSSLEDFQIVRDEQSLPAIDSLYPQSD